MTRDIRSELRWVAHELELAEAKASELRSERNRLIVKARYEEGIRNETIRQDARVEESHFYRILAEAKKDREGKS